MWQKLSLRGISSRGQGKKLIPRLSLLAVWAKSKGRSHKYTKWFFAQAWVGKSKHFCGLLIDESTTMLRLTVPYNISVWETEDKSCAESFWHSSRSSTEQGAPFQFWSWLFFQNTLLSLLSRRARVCLAGMRVRLYAHIGERHDIEDLSAIACHWVNPRKSTLKFEISCQKKLHTFWELPSTCTNI